MKIILFFYFLIIMNNAFSHPVGFSKSYTISINQFGSNSNYLLHYSPSFKYSIGYNQLNDEYDGLYLGYLIKRWNLPKAQGNAYIFGSVGDNFNHQGFQLDYETRKFYTMYKYNKYNINNSNDINLNIFRIGFAPYEGDYSELNTWFIFEYNKENKITPLLRFFYKNVLWETGYNNYKKEVLFNIIIRDYF